MKTLIIKNKETELMYNLDYIVSSYYTEHKSDVVNLQFLFANGNAISYERAQAIQVYAAYVALIKSDEAYMYVVL